MNLLRKLDHVMPNWRHEYGCDPLVAAVELGLIDEETDMLPLNLSLDQPLDAHDWYNHEVVGYDDDDDD